MRRLTVLALCVSTLGLVAGACASTESPPSKEGTEQEVAPDPKPDPEEPAPEPIARAAIASVQMIEDCPNQNSGWRPPPADQGPAAKEEAAAAAAPAAEPVPSPGTPMRRAEGKSLAAGSAVDGGRGPWVQPCTQSTMQVVFTGQGDRSSTVEIEKVRLLDPNTGKAVATLEAREPAAWADGAYQSWNESIGPRQEVKASYELSVPDWYEVEKQIGTGSSGFMFVLELDVKVGDELQTVRSSQFPREMPHVIVT
jgi:hypothetical protein